MRRILGPLILAAVVAVSLWYLPQRGHDDPAETPAAGPAQASANRAPPATILPSVGPMPATNPPATEASAPVATGAETGGEPVEPPGTPVDPTAAAVPRDKDQAARFARYTRAATAFLADFARPDPSVSQAQWWVTVKSHLSGPAAEAYSGTDPQLVPFTTVTGPAVILPTDTPSDLLILARVPTDGGDYRVEMETDAAGIHISRAIPETHR